MIDMNDINLCTSLTDDELQIWALIKAAEKVGLITDFNQPDKEKLYFTCKLKETQYEICLGGNPDSAHPSAERAIRASGFVMRLVDVIRRSYNCYFVQADISFTPDVTAFKNKLIGQNKSTEITSLTESRTTYISEDDSDYYVSSYEIEIEIVATLGESYKRMVDFLTVKMDSEGAEYTHNRNISPKTVSGNVNDNERAEASKYAKKILDLVLNGKLPGESKGNPVVRNNHIKKMLEALNNSEESNFRRFIVEASEKNARVGQISVKPCALLIDAIDDKKYEYDATTREGETGKLSLIWRHSLGALGPTTPLYLRIKNRKFESITNIENENPLPDNINFVLAHTAIPDPENPKSIKIQPDKWTLDDSFAGKIDNYAVPVEVNGKIKYFYANCTQIVDGVRRLTIECEKCALTGDIHYKGVLVNKWYLKDEKINFGKIYTENKNTSSFTCGTCNKQIYYLTFREFSAFFDSHQALDGKHYCDKCGEVITKGGKRYKKTTDVIGDGKKGIVYANIDKNDEFVSIEDGGNVFKCANCGQVVLYDEEKQNYHCDTCRSRICSECASNKCGVPRIKVLNTHNYACSHCMSKETTIDSPLGDAKLKLFTVKDENSQEQLVLDNADCPELVFHCTECEEPRYYDDGNQTNRKCVACGRVICSNCLSKCVDANSCLTLTYCHECAPQEDQEYENAKKDAEDTCKKLVDLQAKDSYIQANAISEIKKHIENNLHQYLSYFSRAEKKRVCRMVQEDGIHKVIDIKCINAAVLENTVDYKFKLSVIREIKSPVTHYYLFYLVNNKLTYGGISYD